MSSSRVAVIIVNWHSEELLGRTLAALNRQTTPPTRVVVVDNGGSGDLPLANYTAGPLVVMRMARNEGFAGGNNAAVREQADCNWVALLNPDAVPREDWLERLLAAAARHPEASAFGSRQLSAENADVVDGLGDVYHVSGAAWRDGHGCASQPMSMECREIFAPCAAAALYKREVFLGAGGFDEDFFCYMEDVDLGFRLRLLGHVAMLVPEAVVYHVGGGTSGGRRSDFAVYHGQRNLVWVYVKNMPAPCIRRYLGQHLLFNIVSLLYFLARGQGGVAFRAKWHALKGLGAMLAKRRFVQADVCVPVERVRAAMAEGWCLPYRRRRPIDLGGAP